MKIRVDEHYKAMYRGYPIDEAQIGNVSTSDRSIKLLYSGKLPCDYDRAEIHFIVRPHYVSVVLHVYYGDNKHEAFDIKADRDEIAKVLHRFFFAEGEPNVFYTRKKNGLTEYWNAYKQAEYMMWEEYTRNYGKIMAVVRQLNAEQRKSLLHDLQRMEA